MKNVVFSYLRTSDAAKLTLFWSPWSSSTRSQRGAGILNDQDSEAPSWHRTLSESPEILLLDSMTGTGAIRHVRYATAGEASE